MSLVYTLCRLLADKNHVFEAHRLSLISPACAFEQTLYKTLIPAIKFLRPNFEITLSTYPLKRLQFWVENGFGVNALLWFETIIRRFHSLDIIEFLLSNGMDVNTRGEYDMTALMHAAEVGNSAIIKFLVQKGANMYTINYFGATAIDVAIYVRNKETITALIEIGHLDIQKDILFIAVLMNNYPLLKLLLECGADVNKQNTNLETALMKAVRNGHRDFVELLLQYNADLEIRNVYGETPLLIASITHDDMVRFLIEKGACVHVRDAEGRTPLMRSIFFKQYDLIQLYINYGMDVNARDNFNKTALIYAVLSYPVHMQCIECLLDSGATIDDFIKDDIHVFSEWNRVSEREKIVDLLLRRKRLIH